MTPEQPRGRLGLVEVGNQGEALPALFHPGAHPRAQIRRPQRPLGLLEGEGAAPIEGRLNLVGDPGGLIGADAHVRLIGRRHDDDLAGCLAEKALGELTGHRGAVDGLAAVALGDRYRALIDGDAVIEARLASRFIDGGAQRLQGLLVEGKGDVDGNAVARRLHTLRKTAFSAHSEGTGDCLVYGKPRAQRAALGDPHLLVGPGLL